MAQYEADKIVQLLRLCSWMARTEMKHSGLHALHEKLDFSESETAPNEKYFFDLYMDAKDKAKKDNRLVKNEQYIDALLHYVGFRKWDDWKIALSSAANYLSPENAKQFLTSSNQPIIVLSDVIEKKVTSLLSFAKRHDAYTFEERVLKTATANEQAERILELAEEQEVVIWALPLTWKDYPTCRKEPSWKKIIESKRIVPVWVDTNSEKELMLNVSGVRIEHIICGVQGILMALLYLEELVARDNDTGGSVSEEGKKGAGVSPVYNNQYMTASGFFLQGATVNHLNTSDNQTINNNYFD